MNIEKLQELERLTAAASGEDPPLGAMTAFFNAMEPATVAELIAVVAAQPAQAVDAGGERKEFDVWCDILNVSQNERSARWAAYLERARASAARAAIAQQAAPASAPVDAAGERAAFQAWAITEDGGWLSGALNRNHADAGDYSNDDVQSQWEAWQAGRAALAAQRQAAQGDATDTARLDFVIANSAFILWKLRDGTIKQCQLMNQDEDEDFHALSGPEDRYFNTPRDAIDAAIAQARAAG